MKTIEIERRWLLKRMPHIAYDDRLDIQQFYGNNSKGNFRLRKSYSNKEHVYRYYVTKKKKLAYGTFVEIEQEITYDSYKRRKRANKNFKTISKRRWIAHLNGLKYEIDAYYGINLIILEIEIPRINMPIKLHRRVSNQIILEITGIEELSNFKLSE